MNRTHSSRAVLYSVLAVLLVLTTVLTVAYAALNVQMDVSGRTEFSASWGIVMNNVKVTSGSVSAPAPSINGDIINFNVTLSQPGEFYEFTFDIANTGTMPVIVKQTEIISEAGEFDKNQIDYFVGLSTGDPLTESIVINEKHSKKMKIRVGYKRNNNLMYYPEKDIQIPTKVKLHFEQSLKNNNGKPTDLSIAKVYRKTGTGTNIGDVLIMMQEEFYVISTTTDTVSVIPKYNLENNFRQEPYCRGKVEPNSDITTLCGYAERDSEFEYSFYQDFLDRYRKEIANYKIPITEVRSITLNELKQLGCVVTDEANHVGNCKNAPKWLTKVSFWSGEEINRNNFWAVGNEYGVGPDNLRGAFYSSYQYGYRPVVTIPKNIINAK